MLVFHSFAVWALRLLNSLVMSAESLRQRIHLQEELREAGFDSEAVLKTAERVGVEGAAYGALQAELQRWRDSYVDVSDLGQQLDGLSVANRNLSQELTNLREANMKLLEENVLLKAVGGEVHEQFIALQRRLETHGLPSAPSPSPSVSDSDISSIGPVRRGTVIRKPSRTTSSRSHQADSKGRAEQLRATTPDMLARQSPAGHVSSDTFTYASGHKVLKDMHPEPLPRTTSLNQAKECLSHSQPEEFTHDINANNCEDLSLMAPCYVSPMDFRSVDTNDDATINRYTPPVPSEGQGVACAKGKNRLTAHQQRAKGCVPSLKRKAPKAPLPNGRIANSSNNNNGDSNKSNSDSSSITLSSSPLSSSTSSLSSASSNVSGKMQISDALEGTNRSGDYGPTYQNSGPSLASISSIERQIPADPEYQNVRRRNGGDECQGSDDGDYQQDTAVYEAITLGPDTIEMVSRASSSGCSSQESSAHRSARRSGDISSGHSEVVQENKQVQRKGGSNENNSKRTCDATEVSRVHESVKHYENIATNGLDGINAGIEKKYTRNKLFINSADFIEKDTRSEDIHLNSADSSLSINSQNTVKEKRTLENIEDRASPDGRTSDELEIVPSRQPQMDPKRRSKVSRDSPTCDPILLFEFDSPTETSDTETWPEHCPPSPRTIETASTRSFGFIAAPRGLKRRDTITEYGTDCGESVSGRRIGLKRSESFQAGDSVIGESIRSRAIRRRGSSDHLPSDVDIGGQQELHINGRTFVRYSPQDVLLNNEMNDLLTAALNRRQCRSVEDRLDQWLEEDLRRYQPEAALILKGKVRGGKKKDMENFANVDESRFGLKSEKNNNKNKSSSQHHNQVGKSKSHAKRFSSCDLIAFNGFINPSPALVESDYGPNFMLNRPSSKRKTEFLGDKAEFGLHEFPPTNGIPHWTAGESRWGGLGADPAIPTPDYGVTPAGTLTPAAAGLARHILDIPSGLY